MSYQLKHGQTLGDNLRRICRKQIEGAIAITTGEKKTSDTPVHEVRKHLKKARAALRLVRKEIGHGLFREQDRCLRGVAKLTSEIRDAVVRLRTLRPINPVVLKNLSDDLRAMANLLGRAHDLSFLGDRLRGGDQKSEWEREGHKLLAVIEVSQGDLQRGAAELAEHFFAERPRDFGDRIAGWLKDWESEIAPSLAEALVR